MTDNKINESPTMCMLPWDSVAIRPFATAIPCCRYYVDNQVEFARESSINGDFRNSPAWIHTRQRMLDGIRLPECKKCYREEDSGISSTRVHSIKERKEQGTLPTTTDVLPLRFLEIAFSNLCNLACVSCSRYYSSTWASEDYKHGRLPAGQKALVQHGNDLEGIDISHVDTVKIIGGEPFMDQPRFINLLKKLNLTNLTIRISTNGTVLPNEELKSLIDKCRQIVLDVSVDGFESVNEWYRWPTKWDELIKNIYQYQAWWGNDHRVLLQIHTVINAYSIWTLGDMLRFFTKYYPNWAIDSDWITIPEWQNVVVIPEKYKAILRERLKSWDNEINPFIRFNKGNPFKVGLERLSDPPNHRSWQEFKDNSLRLAKERNIDLFAMVPDLLEPFKT